MSGIFSRWQPRYAEHGIATFPVSETKRPCVRGWHKIGLGYSATLAKKFVEANALGYVTGCRSNVTVLDIDTDDQRIAEDAIAHHGQPVLVTRTASGKLHLLYRYNGERRRLRPWPELPIDVLGDNGFVLEAPSKVVAGSYEIVHGHFDDLANLQPMANPPSESIVLPLPAKWAGMRQGDGRNNALFIQCLKTGRNATIDQMIQIARDANQQFKEPMMDAEVVKTAASAWKIDDAGLNFFARPRVMLDHDTVDALAINNPDAMVLFILLERYHGGNDRFVLAKPIAAKMGWTLPRWYSARDYLVGAGLIRCIHCGGRGPHDPPIYGWGAKG